MTFLERIRIVLVGTQHPGNIGSAARAMKTMGLRELRLVAPRAFPHPEATALAAGADDLLERAQVCTDLGEALADCAWVAASTARPRHISVPVYTPREWAQRLAGGAVQGRIALLFGSERVGLSNRELDHAQEIVTIPVDPGYGSLNLGAAVQVLCYELRLASGALPPEPEPHRPVDQAELERYYEHLQRVLVRTRFLDPDNPRLLMRRLRRLYSRAAPDANEMNILRGMLTAVEDSLRRAGGKP